MGTKVRKLGDPSKQAVYSIARNRNILAYAYEGGVELYLIDSNTNINSVQRYSDCPDTDYVLPQLYLVLRRLYCLDIGRMRMSCWWVGVRSSRSSRLPIPSPLIRLIRSPVPLKSPAIHEYCQFTVPHSLVQLLDQWLGFD